MHPLVERNNGKETSRAVLEMDSYDNCFEFSLRCMNSITPKSIPLVHSWLGRWCVARDHSLTNHWSAGVREHPAESHARLTCATTGRLRPDACPTKKCRPGVVDRVVAPLASATNHVTRVHLRPSMHSLINLPSPSAVKFGMRPFST